MPSLERQRADELRRHLRFAPGERLYGVVDAARDAELLYEARILFEQPTRTLFEGPLAASLDYVAPHVVPTDPDGGYMECWIRRLGRSAGILLVTSADLDALRAHLRSIFVVRDGAGEEFFFRYYDPRVLRDYLPTCTPKELEEFFGPVRCAIAENKAADAYVAYWRGPGGLQQAEYKVTPGGVPAETGQKA